MAPMEIKRTPTKTQGVLTWPQWCSNVHAMTQARRVVVAADEVGVYHCISRCVRRAFLCGEDAYSGRNYEHRRAWIRDRVRFLSGLFGMEVFAYSVMGVGSPRRRGFEVISVKLAKKCLCSAENPSLLRQGYGAHAVSLRDKGRIHLVPTSRPSDLCIRICPEGEWL